MCAGSGVNHCEWVRDLIFHFHFHVEMDIYRLWKLFNINKVEEETLLVRFSNDHYNYHYPGLVIRKDNLIKHDNYVLIVYGCQKDNNDQYIANIDKS